MATLDGFEPPILPASAGTTPPLDESGNGPELTVIVVNWNAGALLRDCIASYHEAFRLKHVGKNDIVIVDNCSTDGSLAAAAGWNYSRLIKNRSNRGFGAACNQGAQTAVSEYLLFLNPDCRVAEGSIEACIARLKADPLVGAVGVALVSDDGRVSRSCHRFPTFANVLYKLSGLSALSSTFPDGSMTDWAHDTDREVDHIVGAFCMVRRKEFLELGGFDERFFVYLEDLDLSLRYRQRGQHCLFLAGPASYHKGGGVSRQARAARLFYATRSRVLYAFKHFTPMQAWMHLVATLCIEPAARVVQLLMQHRVGEIGEVVRGFGMLCRGLPATLRRARRA